MKFNLIVALCKNGGIGKNNKLPWQIKEDLCHFSKLTKGNGKNAVIMGSKTYLSLPLPNHYLPGRDHFILSNTLQLDKQMDDTHLIKSFPSITHLICYLEKINDNIYEEVWIIGGSQIYKQFIERNLIHKCYLTYIDKEYECDTFFHPFPLNENWKLIKSDQKTTSSQLNLIFMEYINTHITN